MLEGVHLRYIVSTFVNVTMYPQYNNNMIIRKERRQDPVHMQLEVDITKNLSQCTNELMKKSYSKHGNVRV
jgi:hypothetical protein